MYFLYSEYICLTIFCIWILFLIYLKIKSPFWFHQPVYHSYQIFPRFFTRTPYVIRLNLPRKNNYCDFIHISTDIISRQDEFTRSVLSPGIDLLQCHNLSSDNILFIMTWKQMETQFIGQSYPSLVSYYYENEFVQCRENETNSIIQIERSKIPIGMITSRVTRIFYKTDLPIYLYYWDYICVHRDYKKKNLSRYLIQTHEYNQRHMNREIMVSLLKKENTLCSGVVPLVEYDTFLFPIFHDTRISKLPLRFLIKRIFRENISKWMDILEFIRISGMFDILILSDIPVYNELILSELWYIYYLVFLDPVTKQEEIMAVYIFKDALTVYDHDGGYTVQCIASIRIDSKLSDLIFFRGFLHILREVICLEKTEKQYKMLFIENISHNGVLLDKWREKYSMRLSHPCAYYLYNYMIPQMTISKEKVLVLL